MATGESSTPQASPEEENKLWAACSTKACPNSLSLVAHAHALST